MDTPTTPSPQHEEPTEGGEPTREARPEKPKRQRKPLTDEQRRMATDRQAINRRLEEVFSSKDPEAIARARATLEGRGAEAAATTLEAPKTTQATSSEPGKSAPPPGWPKDEETAMARPLADAAVQSLAMVAGLWGVDLARPRVLGEGVPPVVFTEELAKASAPVIAKHVPNVMMTPEGLLGATLLTIISVCVMEVVKAKAEAQAAGVQAVVGAGTPATESKP